MTFLTSLNRGIDLNTLILTPEDFTGKRFTTTLMMPQLLALVAKYRGTPSTVPNPSR